MRQGTFILFVQPTLIHISWDAGVCWRTVLLYILTHVCPHMGQIRGFGPTRERVRTIRSEYPLDSHNINYLATTMIKLPN